jgi:hypothetical protein
MRPGHRLRLRPAIALELGPDTSECRQRAIVAEREPHRVFLLRLRVLLGRVFREAVERHEAAVLRLEPSAPARRCRIADVGVVESTRADIVV